LKEKSSAPIAELFRKHGWTALRLLFAAAFLWLVLRELRAFPEPHTLWQWWKQQSTLFWIVPGLLAIANWTLESAKWHLLANAVTPLPFRQSAQAALAGAAVSNVIPFRIGEYIGRLMWIPAGHRIAAAALSVFGSLSQMVFTLLFGLIALAGRAELYKPAYAWTAGLVLGGFIAAAILLHRRGMPARGKNYLERIVHGMRVLSSKNTLFLVLLSLLRYGVFCISYAWILREFELVSTLGSGWQTAALIFFLQSFFPSVAALDIGVRVAVPLLLLPGRPETPVVAAALSIYTLNILLPSLAGLLAILRKRLR
jgi:hypothetical protein